MVDSVRGTRQRRQPRATVRDLIGERALEHSPRPQAAAVVQMHVHVAAVPATGEKGFTGGDRPAANFCDGFPTESC